MQCAASGSGAGREPFPKPCTGYGLRPATRRPRPRICLTWVTKSQNRKNWFDMELHQGIHFVPYRGRVWPARGGGCFEALPGTGPCSQFSGHWITWGSLSRLLWRAAATAPRRWANSSFPWAECPLAVIRPLHGMGGCAPGVEIARQGHRDGVGTRKPEANSGHASLLLSLPPRPPPPRASAGEAEARALLVRRACQPGVPPVLGRETPGLRWGPSVQENVGGRHASGRGLRNSRRSVPQAGGGVCVWLWRER